MKSFLHLRPDVATLLLALVGCGGAPPAPTAPTPVPAPVETAAVVDSAEADALAELLRMEDERRLDGALVEASSEHANRVVRSHAALAIGRVRDHARVGVLVALLDDSSATVRGDAAFALGLLADSGSGVVDGLARLLGDRDPLAGREAAAALARIGSTSAWQSLLTHIEAAGTPLGVVAREALLHLWRYPRGPAVLAAVTPHLGAENAQTRWSAAYALARPGGATAVLPLLPLAADPDPDVRAIALRPLRAPAADSVNLRSEALDALRRNVEHDHPHVRINALTALATFREAADAAAVADRLDDEDGNVRVAAAQALGEVGGPIATARLSGAARDGNRKLGVRAAALATLARVDPAAGLAVAGEWSTAADWLERLHATRVLASLAPAAEATAHLIERARDPDPRVAAAALRAIGGVESTAAIHALLAERLASADAAVRAAAASALARHPSGTDLALLMEAYDRAQHDSVPSATFAVIDALAALEQRGTPAAHAFFLRFPTHPDPRVHRRVVERFGEAGWGPSPEGQAPNPRPAPDYAAVVRALLAPALVDDVRPQVAIGTDEGEIVLALAPEYAPLTTLNFLSLIRSGYYVGNDYGGNPSLRWHRVVPNFVLQDGDPRGDGSGNPGYAIRDELNRLRYERGVLGMALSGPDTGGAQFFITHSPQPHLDAGYTVFGRVVAGMDVADRIVQDDPIHYIREVR